MATATAPHAPGVRGRDARRPRAGGRRATLLCLAGWAVLAMSAATFLIEAGPLDLADPGTVLTAVGTLAGLVSTAALLLMLLLAARIPLIDRTLGQPRASAAHARMGELVVIGLVLHAVAALAGNAVLDAASILSELGYFWAERDFVLAVAGLAVLLAVALASLATARRRLPYEVWHLIHLGSYAAVGLSIPHMFSMSGLLAQGAWQRTYWLILLSLTGASLAVFRVLVPVWRSARHRIRVERVVGAGADLFHVEFTGRALDRLGAQAGQYLHWRFLAPGMWWHQHPFSLSDAPRDGRLRITVRVLGSGTAALRTLKPGTPVLIEGPYGRFTHEARTTGAVTLVGAGAGLAPIRALLADGEFDAERSTVIARASGPQDVVLGDELAVLCARRGVRMVHLVGHRAAGDRWLPAGSERLSLAHVAPDVAATDLYVCGPDGFTASVLADARAAGVPRERIHTEAFAFAV